MPQLRNRRAKPVQSPDAACTAPHRCAWLQGYILGFPLSFCVVWPAHNLGETCCFLLARHCLLEEATALIERKPALIAFKTTVKQGCPREKSGRRFLLRLVHLWMSNVLLAKTGSGHIASGSLKIRAWCFLQGPEGPVPAEAGAGGAGRPVLVRERLFCATLYQKPNLCQVRLGANIRKEG